MTREEDEIERVRAILMLMAGATGRKLALEKQIEELEAELDSCEVAIAKNEGKLHNGLSFDPSPYLVEGSLWALGPTSNDIWRLAVSRGTEETRKDTYLLLKPRKF